MQCVCLPVKHTATRTVAEKQGIAIIELIPQDKRELAFSVSAPKIPTKIQLDDATIGWCGSHFSNLRNYSRAKISSMPSLQFVGRGRTRSDVVQPQ